MYLEFLNYLSYFFNFLFFAFLFWALDYKKVKLLWNNAVTKVKIKKMIQTAESEEKRPFYFNRGKTVVYATTEEKAKHDYRRMKFEAKRTNHLKKA